MFSLQALFGPIHQEKSYIWLETTMALKYLYGYLDVIDLVADLRLIDVQAFDRSLPEVV
jgi:hypothetical protein